MNYLLKLVNRHSKSFALAFAATAIFGIQWIYFLTRSPNPYDEGIWLEVLRHTIQGARPYIDFTTDYGPLYLLILSKLTGFLGGRLVALRFAQGIFQGTVCFFILFASIKREIGFYLALAIVGLYAFSVAHPAMDPTMYWGLRYFIALIPLALINRDFLNPQSYSLFQRCLIFSLFFPLFYYSGEAGAYCVPSYGLWLLLLLYSERPIFKHLLIYLGSTLAGFCLVTLLLGKATYLYPEQLFLVAPRSYGMAGFSYPHATFSNFHYYFPFITIVFGLIAGIYFLIRKNSESKVLLLGKSFSFLGPSLALLIAMKVSTTRSDSMHLAYCYPFVLYVWAQLFCTFRARPFLQVMCATLLLLSFLGFFNRDSSKAYFKQVGSFVIHNSAWIKDPNWGIYEKADEYEILTQVRAKFDELVPRNGRFTVFPFEQILYSGLARNPLSVETVKPCSLRPDRSQCSETFNYTRPDYVLWIPEETKYSWVFDGFYSGFEYPSSFLELKNHFDSVVEIKETGWKVFRRNTSVNKENTTTKMIEPNWSQWQPCSSQQNCSYLGNEIRELRLEPQSKLECLNPSESEVDRMKNSPGISIPKTDFLKGKSLEWFCVHLGQADCRCSRIRKYEQLSPVESQWVWDGLLKPVQNELKSSALFFLRR